MLRSGARAALCGLLLLLLAALALVPAGAAADCPNALVRGVQGFSGLPDCRGLEVVSPQLKNGADIAGMPSRTRVATDGNAVQYTTLTAFGDARGTSIAGDFMALRTAAPGASGWVTHGITPGDLDPGSAVQAFVAMFESRYVGEFSPDLNRGVFLSNSDFRHSDPNVAAVPNLYVRSDLRSAGAGSYQLLTGCPACAGVLPCDPQAPQPSFAGASADYSHVILESAEPLTADTAGCVPVYNGPLCPVHLYEWVGSGGLRSVGWVPPVGQTVCGPAPLVACVAADNAQAGRGAAGGADGVDQQYTPNTISADGSRIFFTVNTGAGGIRGGCTCGSITGCRMRARCRSTRRRRSRRMRRRMRRTWVPRRMGRG